MSAKEKSEKHLPKSSGSDFDTIMRYIKALQSRYHKALSAFHVFDTSMKLTASNKVGLKKAKRNIKVINDFRYFFLISREAVRVYFFLELAKMFDISKQALQVNKIINFTESNNGRLSREAFAEHNKNRELIEPLIKGYEGVSKDDLKKLRRMLAVHKPIIDKLLIYRDKWLAHDDINKPEVPNISATEIEKLFDVLAKIINILGSKLNSETWEWNHISESSETHTTLVIEYLARFEPYRIKEIDQQAEREMKKWNKLIKKNIKND